MFEAKSQADLHDVESCEVKPLLTIRKLKQKTDRLKGLNIRSSINSDCVSVASRVSLQSMNVQAFAEMSRKQSRENILKESSELTK